MEFYPKVVAGFALERDSSTQIHPVSGGSGREGGKRHCIHITTGIQTHLDCDKRHREEIALTVVVEFFTQNAYFGGICQNLWPDSRSRGPAPAKSTQLRVGWGKRHRIHITTWEFGLTSIVTNGIVKRSRSPSSFKSNGSAMSRRSATYENRSVAIS